MRLELLVFLDKLSRKNYCFHMKTLPVGELKAQFSEVLEKVSHGEVFGITHGKKKKPVAMIVPYQENSAKKARKIGLYNGKITIKIAEDFEISEQDLLGVQ